MTTDVLTNGPAAGVHQPIDNLLSTHDWAARPPHGRNRAPVHILLIAHVPEIRNRALNALVAGGVVVTVVDDALQVLTIAASDLIEAVVLLPAVVGSEHEANVIAALRRFGSLPVLLIGAMQDDGDGHGNGSGGPFDIPGLVSRVRRLREDGHH